MRLRGDWSHPLVAAVPRRLAGTGRLLTVLIWLSLHGADARSDGLPEGFVYVSAIDPTIRVELRYATSDNFVGRQIAGYERPVAILTAGAAAALHGVQDELRPFGLGLKLFDGYRPQRAVNQFVAWANDGTDRKMKASYYPDIPKRRLIPEGYIAERSGHSRGSTVDVTLVPLDDPDGELDMGSPWDFFGPDSRPSSPTPTPAQRAHRLLLRTVMIEHGFDPLEEEWWHFTLADEPFPATYFDFPVR